MRENPLESGGFLDSFEHWEECGLLGISAGNPCAAQANSPRSTWDSPNIKIGREKVCLLQSNLLIWDRCYKSMSTYQLNSDLINRPFHYDVFCVEIIQNWIAWGFPERHNVRLSSVNAMLKQLWVLSQHPTTQINMQAVLNQGQKISLIDSRNRKRPNI